MAHCFQLLLPLLVLSHVLSARATERSPNSSSTTPAPQTVLCKIYPGSTPEDDTLLCGDRIFYAKQIEGSAEEETLPVGSAKWWSYVALSLFCVTCGALAAGLTLGMLGLNPSDLELSLEINLEDVPKEDKEEVSIEQSHAKALLPVIGDHFFAAQFGHCMPHGCDPTNHHYLLVTLLLVNACANEALPIFLDSVVPSWAAVLVSVSFVLVFGEIIPSAIFTGPNQLTVAAKLCPLVKALKVVFMPLVWPISLLLDKLLGHEQDTGFKHFELKALMKTLRTKSGAKKDFDEDEWDMMSGALDLSKKQVGQWKFMTNWDQVASIRHDTILDEDGLAGIRNLNHSRLLVHKHDPADPSNKRDIVGMVLVKKLIGIDPTARKPLSDLPLRQPLVFDPTMSLLKALQIFQKGQSHMAVITVDKTGIERAWQENTSIPKSAAPVGIITIEDIIEEMLNDEIFDEVDREETLFTLTKSIMIVNERMKIIDRLKELASRARKTIARKNKRSITTDALKEKSWKNDDRRAWTVPVSRGPSLGDSLLP